MTTRDEIIVKFTADIAEFNKRISAMEGKVAESTKTIDKNTSLISNSFKSMGYAIAGALSVQAMTNFARESVNLAQKMDGLNLMFEAAFGSAQKAGEEYEYLSELTNKLGLNTLETAGAYAKFTLAAQGSGLSLEQSRKTFEQFAGAFRVFGLSSFEAQGALKALEQIASKGTLSMEELRLQLGDRLPNVMEIAATSMGMTTAKFIDMVSNGLIPANDFLVAFGNEFEKRTKGQIDEASKSASASFARFENAVDRLKIAIGVPLSNALAGAIENMFEFSQSLNKILDDAEKFNKASDPITEFYTRQTNAANEAKKANEEAIQSALKATNTKFEYNLPQQKQEKKLRGFELGESEKEKLAKTATKEEQKKAEKLREDILTASQKYKKALAEVETLQKKSLLTDKEAARAKSVLTDEYQKFVEKQDKHKEKLEELEFTNSEIMRTIADDLEDAFARPINSIEEFRGVAINALKEIALQATITALGLNYMASPFKDGITKGIGSIIGSALSSAVSGGINPTATLSASGKSVALSSIPNKPILPRASGGLTSPNSLYRVNEKGAEMFSVGGKDYLMTGDKSGRIQPNSQGVTIQQNINVSAGVPEAVRAEMLRMLPTIKATSVSAVIEASKRGGALSQATGAR